TWTVTYTVTVGNPHLSPAGGLSYLLDDVLTFPAGVSVIDVTAVGPADAPVNPAFDGATDPAILTAPDRVPAAIDAMTPALRTFTITVVTDVPAGAIGDPSTAACAPAGTGGYTNAVELSSNGSVLAASSACSPVLE